MSRLFAKLYLDEDVDVLIATLVRARGFEVETTTQAENIAASDERQLIYAADANSVMVTHNRVDFEILYEEWHNSNTQHSGIVIAVRRNPYDVAERLLNLLNNFTADEMVNQIIYV